MNLDQQIATAKEEDQAAVRDRMMRLYKTATKYLGTDNVKEEIRDILNESSSPLESAKVAMSVMRSINNNFQFATAKGLVDRLLDAVGNSED